MSAAKAIEYRIIRHLLAQSLTPPTFRRRGQSMWIERLIAVVAATAGVFVLGAVLQELLWVVIAAAFMVALATPGDAMS